MAQTYDLMELSDLCGMPLAVPKAKFNPALAADGDGAGTVVVKKVPTEFNPADLFTKVLGHQEFALREAGVEALE